MYEIFADLHVHIGRSENGKPIKITAARSLNFANIAKECAERKGINVVGIIDCASPYVIEDIENFLKTGEAYELKDGGIIYKDKVCILLGSEVETSEPPGLPEAVPEWTAFCTPGRNVKVFCSSLLMSSLYFIFCNCCLFYCTFSFCLHTSATEPVCTAPHPLSGCPGSLLLRPLQCCEG